MPGKHLIMGSQQIHRVLSRIAHEIVDRNEDTSLIALVGIQRGGVYLAQRLSSLLEGICGHPVPVGSVDVTMHRDDLDQRLAPEVHPTKIPFDPNGRDVVLVDDVLFKGRTTRAALDALIDFGRPRRIQLAVLVDRGHRELPIKADYVGRNVETQSGQEVVVELKEAGNAEDTVCLVESKSEPA